MALTLLTLLGLALVSGLLAVSPMFNDGTNSLNADALIDRGRELVRSGDAAGGERVLNRAIQMRPRWPAGWSALAASQLDRDDLSGLQTAETGLKLGPNDGHLYVELWPRWLFHWRAMNDDQRRDVLELADRMSRRFPDWTVEMATRYGQLYPVCDRLALRARAANACKRAGWTPLRGSEGN